MKFSIVLLSILGLAVASPVVITKIKESLLRGNVVTRNSALENLILGLLEDLRGTMVNGSDDVPVLDPLVVEEIKLDDEVLPFPGSHVTVNGLKVFKLSSFVVDNLSAGTASIIPLRYRLEFDIHVPVLESDASNYDLLVSAAGVSIFGNGDAKVSLIEPRVKGTLVLGPRLSIGSGMYLTITNSDVNFTLKGFESQINGLLNDDAMSAFINTFLKHFVPDLVQLYEADISEFLSDIVQEIGNEFLADLNVGGILGRTA